MNIILKYTEELKQDLYIDQINVKDKQMQLPGIKHKWVGRLIQHKHNIKELKNKQKETRGSLINQISDKAPVSLSKQVLEKTLDNHDDMLNISKQIQEEELTVEYLEHVVDITRGMSYDIKNIVDIIKLEET